MMKRTRFGGPLALAATLALLAAACAPAGGPTQPGAVGATVVPPAPGTSSPSPVASTEPAATSSPTALPSAPPATGTRLVKGLVIDINRDPLPGAQVIARLGDQEVGKAETGADGAYRLTVPAGDLQLTATKAGFTSRTLPVAGAADVDLNFGPTAGDQANPFFLADTPEIDGVEVIEQASAGPLTLKVHVSEPLPEASRAAWQNRFELRASREDEFLVPRDSGDERLLAAGSWDDAGRVYTFTYAGPYLPGAEYTVGFDQDVLTTRDPETQELEWEDLGIVDAKGNALGRGRADYAFKGKTIFPPALEMLTDPDFGYYVQDRRWRLSHDAGFTFTAMPDTTPPKLTRVELSVDDDIGRENGDILKLWFDEPMSVARDKQDLEFTRLDEDRPPVILNVATDEAGKKLEPLNTSVQIRSVVVDYNDPRIVYVVYPRTYFDAFEFVEVTLTPEAMDPAGNPPDPKANRLGGPIIGN